MSFNKFLLEKLGIDSKQKLYWIAEHPVGRKEVDIVGTPTGKPITGENAMVVIECKMEADFSDHQLGNYAKWIRHGKIHTILKYYSTLEKQKKELWEKAKANNDVVVEIAEPIYWCEIFYALDKINNAKLRKELQSIFQQFGLDVPLFAKEASAKMDHLRVKNCLAQKMRNIVNEFANDKISVCGLRIGKKQKGFFNFVIYPKAQKCNRTTFFGTKPSCNILVSGFLPQGASTGNQKITSTQLLQVDIRFYYDLIDTQSDKVATNLHEKGWNGKHKDGDVGFVSAIFHEHLENIDNANMIQYFDKLQLFLKNKISDWKNAINRV